MSAPPDRRTADRWIAAAGLALLLALHLDAWRPQRPALYLGWLPEELCYRLAWMALAWLYLGLLTARLWRDEEPPP